MKKKAPAKKLRLSQETLFNLTPEAVFGGAPTTNSILCPPDITVNSLVARCCYL